MEREDKFVVPYNKKKIIKLALKLFKSPKKVMIIDYEGKRLNSIYGLEEDIKHIKIPIKYIFIYLIKKFLQVPFFRAVRNTESEFKNRIYRLFGMKIGKEVFIACGAYIDDNFPELITIGDGSIIGKDVSILAHEFTIKHARFGKVTIGKQVLIGANSMIRSGVTIGDGAVIAMDSFVNRDIPAKEEWGGIPAHKIKKLRKLI